MELLDTSNNQFENSLWRQSSKGKWLMSYNNRQQNTEELAKLI